MKKINLHCHSNYSDSYYTLEEMAVEHQKQGFSAFVVTDHCYPSFIKDNADTERMLTSYHKFCAQTKELSDISQKLNFPCIQGIELALYGEEVLVFGNEAIKEIFAYAKNMNERTLPQYIKSNIYNQKLSHNLINILQTHKENTGIILCHPHLWEGEEDTQQKLFALVDGYEFQNSGRYFFSDYSNADKTNKWDREVPAELQHKKKFYNSDAHTLRQVSITDGNFHTDTIHTVEDLISFVKSPSNHHLMMLHKAQQDLKYK